MVFVFYVLLKKAFPNPGLYTNSPMFSLNSFIAVLFYT